ncbi:MAG: IS66 family transposase [Terriglobales bacterium]
MILRTAEHIEHLAHEELVALVKVLMAENVALRAELDTLRQPPPTSRNSSQPPSRDAKCNLPAAGKRKKLGPPFGHARTMRPGVEQPDRIIEAAVEWCRHCHADLRGVEPRAVVRRQLTELPPITPVVIETWQPEVVCPGCQRSTRGELPEGLEAHRSFGPRLAATVVYLKHEQHLSYERVRQLCRELFGVALSEGGASALLQRAGAAARPVAAAIGAQVAQSAVIGSDETSARVAGRTWWQWVFRSMVGVYFLIRASRGAKVIAEVMGEQQAECWVSDCLSAQLTAPAQRRQVCLAHQLRDRQRLRDRQPRLQWAIALQALFREAIHLGKRRERLSPAGYTRRVTEVERRLDRLLAQRVQGAEAVRLRARYRGHRAHLLVFLHYSGVPPDNNACERALRPSVIHRKVTNGFRSEWGAQAYAALATISATAKLQGRSVFDAFLTLMGPSVLPFVVPQNP